MHPNSTSRRSHRLFVLSGYSVLLAGFVLLGLLPFLRQRSKLESNIADCQRQINARFAARQQLEDIRGRIELIKLQTANYDRLVPANQDQGVFLTQLSAELERTQMKDITVRTLPPNTLGKTQRLPIEVHASGSFANFRQFLEKLEALPRLSTVERLSIDSISEMNGGVDVQLTIFIYNTKPAS